MENNYILITLAIGLIFYYGFISKIPIESKRIVIVIGLGGLFAGIAQLLDGKYPYLHETILNIFAFPIFATLILIFYLMNMSALKRRKDPKERVMMNIFLGLVVLMIILIVIVALLVLDVIHV